MASVFKKALVLAAAVCGGVASGAVSGTRLAVWDGDFSNLDQPGASLDLNGAAAYVEDGSGNKVGIKIGNSGKGLLLKEFSESGITVVFAYSNLTVHAEKPTALAVVTTQATDQDDVGAGIDNSGQGVGYNRGSTYSGSSNPIPDTDKNAIQYYALVYAADSSTTCPGTLAYHITDAGVISTNYYASGLKYTDAGRKVTAVALGGCRASSSSFVSANDMVLTKVMLYRGCLSRLDIARVVKFPGYEYAQNVYTWKTTGSSSANLAAADSKFEDAAGDVYNGTGTNYSLPGASSAGAFWRYFCSGNKVAGQYAAPGSVWRFVPDAENAAYAKTVSGDFGPMTLGGLVVERNAAGYSFVETGDRPNVWGDTNGTVSCRFDISEDFSVARAYASYFSGVNTLTIDSGKTLTFNAGQPAAKCMRIVGGVSWGDSNDSSQPSDGGVLRLCGGGTFATPYLAATNGAEVDYSAQAADRSTPYVQGQLLLDETSRVRLPVGAASYRLASTIGGLPEPVASLHVAWGDGAFARMKVLVDATNGEVTPLKSAFVDASANLADVTWVPAGAPASTDDLCIEASENATLTIDAATTVGSLRLIVAEGKTLTLSGQTLTATDGIVLGGPGTVCVPNTGILAGAMTGSGTLEIAQATTATSANLSALCSAAQLNGYTGSLKLSCGRYVYDTSGCLPSSQGIAVTDGAQLFVSDGLTIANPVSAAGNGWGGESQYAVSQAALRLGNGATMTGALSVPSAAKIGVHDGNSATLNGAVTGAGNLTKWSGGALLIGADVGTSFDGRFIVGQGTVKANANSVNFFGCNTDAKAIRVESGAAFDMNGKHSADLTIELNGGALTNTADGNSSKKTMRKIILSADSRITGSRNYGLIAHTYGASYLDLNNHTLTFDMTTGQDFWLPNVQANAGIVNVVSGRFYTWKTGTTFAGEVRVSGGEFKIQGETSVNTLTLNGGSVTDSSALAVTSRLNVLVDATLAREVTLGEGAQVVVYPGKVLTTVNDWSVEGGSAEVVSSDVGYRIEKTTSGNNKVYTSEAIPLTVTLAPAAPVFQDYTNATIVAAVTAEGAFDAAAATYTATVGGQSYAGTYANGSVTFEIPGSAGASADVTITATPQGGSAAVATTDTSFVFGTATDWFEETAAAAKFGKSGTWTHASADTTAGKIVLSGDANATFTPTKKMTGTTADVVWVVSFDAPNDDDMSTQLADAQTAFRLATGSGDAEYVFQLWIGNAWKNVAAAGFTPAINTEYTVTNHFDYSAHTLTVTVNGQPLTADNGTTTTFALPSGTTKVNSFEFAGSGALTGIAGNFINTMLYVDGDGTAYATLAEVPSGKPVTALNPNMILTVEPGLKLTVPASMQAENLKPTYNGASIAGYVKVSVAQDDGTVTLSATEAAKPSATAMTADGIAVGNVKPGLYYWVEASTTQNFADKTVTVGTPEQATSEAAVTVTPPNPEGKVIFYRVAVDAEKP